MNGQARPGYHPLIGKSVRDPEGKPGIVTDVRGRTAYLRPERGGREWIVPVEQVTEEPQDG